MKIKLAGVLAVSVVAIAAVFSGTALAARPHPSVAGAAAAHRSGHARSAKLKGAKEYKFFFRSYSEEVGYGEWHQEANLAIFKKTHTWAFNCEECVSGGTYETQKFKYTYEGVKYNYTVWYFHYPPGDLRELTATQFAKSKNFVYGAFYFNGVYFGEWEATP